ncbi:hypothetical protein [Desulfuromonas soudanensis]|uniref:hypothetical protein n=1 Tax=Desulfuromonas soudanensis TaxID=1603606 RepID=UPI0012F94CC2|nr:hypothetical protein [Desulfuromonas soudanensis]
MASFTVVLLGKEKAHLSKPGRKTVYQPPEIRPCAIVGTTLTSDGKPLMAKSPLPPQIGHFPGADPLAVHYRSLFPWQIFLVFFNQKRMG